MNVTQSIIVNRSDQSTVIVFPELARLRWHDRLALSVSIWVLEHTFARSQSHSEMLLERHAAEQVARRELASLKWLPPR